MAQQQEQHIPAPEDLEPSQIQFATPVMLSIITYEMQRRQAILLERFRASKPDQSIRDVVAEINALNSLKMRIIDAYEETANPLESQ